MKAYHFKKLFLFSVLSFGASQVSFAACDQTLSPGANVASAISGAAGGTTICLNAGNYGTITLDGVVKTSDVTLQSTSGRTAVINYQLTNINHLKFQNLTVEGGTLTGASSKNFTFINNTVTAQMRWNLNGNSYANFLADGNTFYKITNPSGAFAGAGRFQVAQPGSLGTVPVGVTVSNNIFGDDNLNDGIDGGGSDGLQIGAYGVVVGPGNVFQGIVQLSYTDHVDAIQLYGQSHTTIKGNYFINNDVQIMAPDFGYNELITDNVFIAKNSGNNGIQLGSHTNTSFLHNTVKNITVNMDAKTYNPASQNDIARNNIMINSYFKTVDSNGAPKCNNCTFDHNLFTNSGNASGTSNLIGTPTFIGGSSPTTWAGWQLTSSSLGYQAATDGKDMGDNYFGAGSSGSIQLAAPSNLQVN